MKMLYILHSVVKSAQQSVSGDPDPPAREKAMKSNELSITSTSNS
jgi:hypothetical protein